jgi:hypothetical protein
LSRARDRLIMYAPTKKSNGAKWGLSPFLARLGPNFLPQQMTPARTLPIPSEAAPIMLTIEGAPRFPASQIALYEKCPRRFLYTHILQTGGRRTTTPFMKMHDAVRSVIQSVISGSSVLTNDSDLNQRVSDAFDEHRLSDHGYADDYRSFATSLVQYFVAGRTGHTPETPTALSITIGGEEIVITPDDVLIRTDGVRTFRRVQTGRRRSTDSESVEAAAFLLAVQKAVPEAVVELVHLSDQSTEEFTLTRTQLSNRQAKLADFLQGIRAGQFKAKPSLICPNCPAFFVCGPTPEGAFKKKF